MLTCYYGKCITQVLFWNQRPAAARPQQAILP
jgi:hypothetical protein